MDYYMHIRIPQMLRAYGLPVTTTNMIISFNAGIKSVRDGRTPPITVAYLKKYFSTRSTKFANN